MSMSMSNDGSTIWTYETVVVAITLGRIEMINIVTRTGKNTAAAKCSRNEAKGTV